ALIFFGQSAGNRLGDVTQSASPCRLIRTEGSAALNHGTDASSTERLFPKQGQLKSPHFSVRGRQRITRYSCPKSNGPPKRASFIHIATAPHATIGRAKIALARSTGRQRTPRTQTASLRHTLASSLADAASGRRETRIASNRKK